MGTYLRLSHWQVTPLPCRLVSNAAVQRLIEQGDSFVVIEKCQSVDIAKKGSARVERHLFVLPGLVHFPDGQQVGEVVGLGSQQPKVYLNVGKVRVANFALRSLIMIPTGQSSVFWNSMRAGVVCYGDPVQQPHEDNQDSA